MAKTKAQAHSVSGAFVFLLLGVFAVLSTVTVLLGAGAYRSMSARSEAHDASRIAANYLRSMIRSSDEEGSLRIETAEGVDTVALYAVYDGEAYVTRLYVSGGMLREWFTSADEPFVPEEGEEVCPLDELTASFEDGLLILRLRKGDDWSDVRLALRAAAL